MSIELPEPTKPAKHWSHILVSEYTVSLNYNHPDYAADDISKHYEMLSSEAKAAFDDFKAVAGFDLEVDFMDYEDYEYKTELLAFIAALEA